MYYVSHTWLIALPLLVSELYPFDLYCFQTFLYTPYFNISSRYLHVILAHLVRRAIVSYCHTNVSCLVCHLSTLKNNYSNIFFYKTTGPTVFEFHVEHDLTPGSSSCKTGLGWISKMAAVTKNSKINKTNFFSRTTGYVWLNFGMEY